MATGTPKGSAPAAKRARHAALAELSCDEEEGEEGSEGSAGEEGSDTEDEETTPPCPPGYTAFIVNINFGEEELVSLVRAMLQVPADLLPVTDRVAALTASHEAGDAAHAAGASASSAAACAVLGTPAAASVLHGVSGALERALLFLGVLG
jgi:hypothetical protein